MTSKITTITEKDVLGLAQQLMLWGGFRHLPVVRGKKLVGILSERDLLAQRAAAGKWRTIPVKSAMTPSPRTTAPGTELSDASHAMIEYKIDCLPVMEADHLVGIITTTDVLHAVERGESRSLRMKVSDIMTTQPETAEAEEGLFDAVSRMLENGIRHLPVVDETDRLVGVLSDRDVRAAIGDPIEALRGGGGFEQITVRQVMTPNPAALTTDSPIDEAIAWFSRDGIGLLPIVDEDDVLQGVVSYLDALWYLKENIAGMAATG